jgi:hypothetical protein
MVIANRRKQQTSVFAVLHMGAIKSPVDAVRAAIVQESRASE